MARSSRVSREIDVKQGLVNPSNRSLVKIRRKGEENGSSGRCGGLLSTTTNHVDLNRISFIPVRHRESQVCRAGLATMFTIEKPISLIFVHFIPLPRCPIYLTALFFHQEYIQPLAAQCHYPFLDFLIRSVSFVSYEW